MYLCHYHFSFFFNLINDLQMHKNGVIRYFSNLPPSLSFSSHLRVTTSRLLIH